MMSSTTQAVRANQSTTQADLAPAMEPSRRLVSCLIVCLVVIASLTMGPATGSAQSAVYPGDSLASIAEIDSGSPTAEPNLVTPISFNEISHGNGVATPAAPFAGQGGFDVSLELAAMRDRLQSQENQIATLRSQLHSPLAARSKPGGNRWFSTFESVIVQPLQENTTALIVQTDSGYSHVAFPWELQHSPRIQFGLESTGDSIGWRMRYWQFRHSNSFLANDANGLLTPPNIGTVGYLVEDGDITLGLESIEEGRFTSSIRTDVIDWELQRQIAQPIDVYAGIRYAKVAQRYVAVTDAGSAWAKSSLRGVGPTVALRMQHTLKLDRLSLFANLRGSLLFGQKQFSVYDDVNDSLQTIGSDDTRLSSDGGDTLSGNTEMQIGLRFAPSDWIAFSVAFEAQTFTNVGGPNPTAVFTGADNGLSSDGPMDDSLSFAGVTVGTEVTW